MTVLTETRHSGEFIVSEACLTMTAHEISQVLVQKSGGSHVP